MNIFLCQSIQTQIELEEIADVKRQIITPATSRTIIGIVQDGLIGSYNLTSPNMRIDWKSAMNIMSYTSIDNFAAFKKDKEYTGYELFSMIIPPKINVTRIDKDKPEKTLIIKNGVLEKGYLSKDLLGSNKKNNLTQLIWDEYGVEDTKSFLDNTQRLMNNFNLFNGFTVGIGDTHVSKEVDKQIHTMFETKDLDVAHRITELENNPDLMDIELFERTLFAQLNIIREDVSKLLMANLAPTNNFNIMISSGSKGIATNMGQIRGCVGLQAFEGKLVPKKINRRSLPYFFRDDDRATARGLIKRSFLSGMTFPEFFFHNLTGREGLIDQAIKTAESGYIQRKLIKSMEDIMIRYDGTTRTATGSIVQFTYGDSGADTTKQYEYNMKLIDMNNLDVAAKHKFTKDELANFKSYTTEMNENHYQQLLQFRDLLRDTQIKTRMNYITINTLFMLPVNLLRVIDNVKNDPALKEKKDKLEPKYVLDKLDVILNNKYTNLAVMKKADQDNKDAVKYKDDRVAKTALMVALHDSLSPKRCIFDHQLNKTQFDAVLKDVADSFNKNLAEPGEMVGIIAAQSLGEPTTQSFRLLLRLKS
ncbi:MAG: DNA-directed RNA polymerase subunit alpha [Harvfovirus sp.]|uniref:DNA-directed RNA polymerase n=1 Tax=Harvfovirus sp. TaxID=2487768 RepID=A0A3G5A0X9_9VIRU|nr:MAG: DNA-directed RNA polymerase subunit alpha [Harvfovirus sp.]